VSTTGNQRPEEEPDDGAITVRADIPAKPEANASARFAATIIDFTTPNEMQRAFESAPQTTRKLPSKPSFEQEAGTDSTRVFELLPGRAVAKATLEQAIPQASPAPEHDAAPAMRRATATLPSPQPQVSQRDARFFSRRDPARRLDRYELITEIASGGMATVFLARLQGTGGFQRLVAIKRLHAELAAEPELVEMFLEEARIAAQIHHSHAVPILEIGSSSRGYYLVMEYIEGVTLAQLAQRVAQAGLQMPRRIALRIVVDALSGLHAAHELTDESGRPVGVVHRDVSPQNILVGVDGAARLTDFGVARTTAHVADTKLGALKGKVAYMAPEQIRREAIDRRADLFAMGVILWEVLAGRPLFRADTKFDTIVRALNAPVPRLRDTVFGISDELDDLATRALSRSRRARFQTAVEMADAIEQAARGSIATSREVATFTLKLFSRELNERRTGIRSWLEEAPDTAPPPLFTPALIEVVTRIAVPSKSEQELAEELQEGPESVRITRQFVGSLAPIRVDEDEAIELPMSGPREAVVRRVGIAVVVAVVVAIGVGALWKRGAKQGASAPTTTSGSASASDGGAGRP
jgi:serine/threonine-protein kinase